MVIQTSEIVDGPRRRPGGRNARVAVAAHQAVLELLVEKPWLEVSLPQVAERAGIHHATVYRRWGSLQNLVVDAVITRFYTDPPISDTGSLRGDLEALTMRAVETLTGPYSTALLGALASAASAGTPGDPTPVELGWRRHHVEIILERSRERGQEPPTADEVLDLILGPIYARLLFGTPITADFALGLVDRLLGEQPSDDPPKTRAARKSRTSRY
jgi:AcrR family transcriptional regulator